MVKIWLAAGVLMLAGCAQQGQSAVNPLTQPLGASVTAEPSKDALGKMLPYLGDVYSDAIPTIELRPFRECFGRAVFAMMSPADQTGFEEAVATGKIYDDAVIMQTSREINEAIGDSQVRAKAAALCPKYGPAYASM